MVPEATCRATPAETASKITVTSQTTVTIAAGTSMAEKSVKVQNTEASAKTEHRKRAVGPNANTALHVHKSNPPAVPHLTKAMSASTEQKNPPTEPSHTSKTKTKPSEHLPKVGKYLYRRNHSISLWIPFLSTHFDFNPRSAYLFYRFKPAD